MKTNSTETKENEKKKRIFSLDEYQDAIGSLVHQSFKTTNSNAEAGGVRISESSAIKLPYISARTLMAAGKKILMDRFEGANRAAIYGNIDKIDKGIMEDLSAEEINFVTKEIENIRKTSLVECSRLCPRLRQIFLPLETNGYLSVTPISVGGVSAIIKEAVKTHNDKIFKLLKKKEKTNGLVIIPVGYLQLGGGKPLNVGNLVYSMQSPLVSQAPSINRDYRRAFSIYHNGIRHWRFPKALIDDYVSWRNSVNGHFDQNMNTRNEHKRLIGRMTAYVLKLGSDTRELLEFNKDLFPEDKLLSDSLPDWQKALIDKSLRTHDWAYDFSTRLAHRIAKIEKDEDRKFEYSQQEINSIASNAREFLK